ncbi:PREDICTED: probable disease resistance protein At4g27220 [Populus euphratica]|uniref:Probable disease resistance protein At4g27220 n=1 Tax=Populus euphratica TaxID=75702 RepID=A0AAJ6UWK6_POPEU|nr:PREDICTED: probable disease resistance protein At4g27220 [Populus euphratica]XP_011036275.1 PREDICTED: probable disease resistance protein At4g27220 [Populus euphratica]
MDNLKVGGLQNQTARSNASNPGLDTTLQSQIRGLNTQQVEMVGSKDPFWNHIEDRADGSMKCKFCPHTFANKTSISRIKWHLSGEEGHNVAICRGVTKEVQEAAFLAVCGGNKRLKSTESSINVNDSGISTCPHDQNIRIENMGEGIGRVQREVQVVEPGVGEERISSHAITGNDEVSSNSEDDLQVRGLQNQTATPNASNPGLETSLQSQIRGLNIQQVEMVRSKDPFWNYIEDRADGSMKCKFCPHTFANKTSISRIKWHLSGEEGHNVAICSGVTKEVQEAAFLAMCGGNKRHRSTESSINVNDCGISTCPQEQNIEINMEGCFGRVKREVQVVEPGVGEERISSHAIARNDAVSMTGMRAQEDRVSEGALESRLRTEPVDRSLEQSNAVLDNLAGGAGRIQVGVQGMEQGPGEERIQLNLQLGNDIENTGEGSFQHDAFETIPRTEQVQLLEPQGDSSQFCLDIGKRYDQPCASSVNNEVTMHDEQDMGRVRTEPVEEEEDVASSGRSAVQAGAGARSSKSLKYNNSAGVLLPTSSTKPVGQAFKENMKVIWSLLMDDEVSIIGIYGMGGVGKTTILQHIYNELLQRLDICDHVWWVTVSQDFSIKRLQNFIAKHLDLDLLREVDDLHRAAKLSKELMNKQKWILILDDLWNNFELQKVGIPVPLKGCKQNLTPRSETVCHRMACQYKIKVKPLSEGEAWALFMEKLGCDIALSPEVAKAVARECAGLPLGISIVAGSLKGVDDLHEWRNTLKKLRESEFRDNEVFKLLRFSYDRLGDLALQQCLLYCALFPEDCEIGREELIGYLIDEGIIKGMRSRGDAFDEGHTMLNRLENVCLLESVKMEYDGSIGVKMHNLIRDMAIQILQENSQVMVRAGAQLKELPDADEWTENLIRVSLMQNGFEEIPSSHSPRCPYLSTLLLCHNRLLGFIADSFFKQLHGLKVLDLTWTGIEKLPDPISDLLSLTALLLNNCKKLRHVPSLKKLRALKRLDLSHTALEKMPQGMECLTKLRYLRMNGCGEKEFPSGILPKLSHLQVFVLEECFVDSYRRITVEVKEVGSLRNLEILRCHFKGLSDFAEYLRSRDGIQSLSTYRISVGMMDFRECIDDFPSKTVALGNLSINKDRDFQVKFLNGIQGLVCQFIDARSLCDVLSLENATELKRISIRDCNSMENLVSSSWLCSASPPLPSYNGMFSGLKEFYCVGCNNMKQLFPLVLLPNLELIDVINCEKMEGIIGTTEEESSTSNSITELILPKLISLNLCWLPELKSICSAKLICNSLENISVINCEKLKRMAICLPLLENGQPSPPPSLREINARPKEWWERVVEWEHPNTKDVLSPFVMFREEETTLPLKHI